MIIKCKVDDNGCPQDLDICCAVCGFKGNCGNACDTHDHENCPEAEIIGGGLTAFQSAVPDTIKQITSLIQMKKDLDEQEGMLKATLVKAMEAYGVKAFETDLIKLVYVAPTTRSTIDSARLKKDHPELAEQYTKTSDVAASVRVTLK